MSSPRSSEMPNRRFADDLTVDAFRPRTVSDYLLYVLPLGAGPALWWSLIDVTGQSEPWDADLYWPVMLAASFLLGIALSGSRIPRIETELPLVGFVIAALLVLAQIVSGFFTIPDLSNAVFLPFTIVFWWPLFTAVFGAAATAGVVATRSFALLVRVMMR